MLSGTSWTVVELAGEPTQEPRPRVEFGADGAVHGSTGVNGIMGTYAVQDDGRLALQAATTLMAGPEPAMRQEAAFLRSVVEPVAFTLEEDRLELAGADGSPAVVLAPADRDPEPLLV